MISSMTGFAREAGTTGAINWAWEFKSVNGRNLDIRVRVPPGFDAAGEEARKLVAAAITRGSVQIGLTVQRSEARRAGVRINTEMLLALGEALATLPPSLPFQPATLDGLLQIRGVVEADEQDDQSLDAAFHAVLGAAAARAAGSLVEARRQEGAALLGVLMEQLNAMAALVTAFEAHPARTPEAFRARLKAQMAALLDSAAALDEARLYQEAALLATRADVREELDRLGAHIASSAEMLKAGGAIGRKLDFLAQEFGREASTLCAKANHVELSRLGLELRAIVDQFREQSQNVE